MSKTVTQANIVQEDKLAALLELKSLRLLHLQRQLRHQVTVEQRALEDGVSVGCGGCLLEWSRLRRQLPSSCIPGQPPAPPLHVPLNPGPLPEAGLTQTMRNQAANHKYMYVMLLLHPVAAATDSDQFLPRILSGLPGTFSANILMGPSAISMPSGLI